MGTDKNMSIAHEAEEGEGDDECEDDNAESKPQDNGNTDE